jgi:hypothetical protein
MSFTLLELSHIKFIFNEGFSKGLGIIIVEQAKISMELIDQREC